MRILLLGSTGRIGSLARVAAISAGHDVVSILRSDRVSDAHEGIFVVKGDASDPATLDRVLTGVEAVVAAMGPRSNSETDRQALENTMRTVVGSMQRSSVMRLVALSGAAVNVPGDRKPLADRVMSRIVRRAARHVVAAKQAEFEIFSATDLDWTALRPPLVTEGSPTGYVLSPDLRAGAHITRGDVAQALVDQLEDRTYLRAAPFVLPATG
jgi:putative NADH-flavin reductase